MTPSAPQRLATEIHVATDVEVGHQIQLLMDGADTELLRRVGIGERDRFAVEEDLARVRLVNPGEDLDQGRLPSAVLADEHVDFARSQVERDVIEGDHAGKSLRYPAQLENRHDGTGSDIIAP